MDFEARGMLEDQVDDVIKMAIPKIIDDYTDVPHEIKTILTIEFVEGHLLGVYNMYCMMKEKDPADDNKETIEEIVATRHNKIKNTIEEVDDL